MMKANSPAWRISKHFLIAVAVTLGMLAPRLPLDAIGIPHLVLILQGLPTTVLIVLVAVEPAVEAKRYRWGIVAAFVFSQIGGYLLGRGLFVSGVLGFLIANIAYLTALTTGVRFGQRLVPFAVLGLCGGTVLALAWSKIPSSHIVPVCLYAMAIVSVPAQAIARGLVLRTTGATMAAVGTTLLLISDSAIAIERFYAGFWWAGIFIMATYFAGQWLIATSVGQAEQVNAQ
jgi:uncharacterized membrane protein YhhN